MVLLHNVVRFTRCPTCLLPADSREKHPCLFCLPSRFHALYWNEESRTSVCPPVSVNFFPDSCLCLLSTCAPGGLCSFGQFLYSTWELECHISSRSSYEPCDLCAAPLKIAPSTGRVSAGACQALQGLSHRWVWFIWVQMVGRVVYLSILWLHLHLPKVQLSIAESAFTTDISVKYRQRWLSWWYENMLGPNTGNHIVTVNAIIEMKTLKSND